MSGQYGNKVAAEDKEGDEQVEDAICLQSFLAMSFKLNR
jgi:hypothetical protein